MKKLFLFLAFLCCTSLNSKAVPSDEGDMNLSLVTPELGEGMFLYSLVANGVEIDTKRMILSK